MTCHRIGRWPMRTMGFGTACESSRRRVPIPPQNKTTFIPTPEAALQPLANGRPGIPRAAVAAFMAVDRALARPGGQHGEPEGQMAVEPSTRCFVQRFAGSEGGSQASWREGQPAEHLR